MRTFEDIKKGDTIRWERYGMLTGIPAEILKGKAVKFLKGKKGYADVWMAECAGYTVPLPVTPLRFKGFVKVRK